jgi:hypothetical protein
MSDEKIEILLEGEPVQVEQDKPRDPATGRFLSSASGAAPADVEIVDDTPPADRGRPKRVGDPKIPDDEELAKYGDDVQKRIKSLRYEYHTERREKEEALRLREEAVRFAQNVWQENEALKKRTSAGEEVLKDQATKRVGAELAEAREIFKKAYADGDLDKMTEAQERMALLAAEKTQVDSYRPLKPTATPPPNFQAPVATPDEKAMEWTADNPWFGNDERMTRAALQYHEHLIRNEQVDPRSDEYYEKINNRMRKIFPSAFPGQEKNQVVVEESRPQRSIVAPATRTPPSSAPRKITLTASQVAVANRLGLTLQQYAEQVVKDQNG